MLRVEFHSSWLRMPSEGNILVVMKEGLESVVGQVVELYSAPQKNEVDAIDKMVHVCRVPRSPPFLSRYAYLRTDARHSLGRISCRTIPKYSTPTSLLKLVQLIVLAACVEQS